MKTRLTWKMSLVCLERKKKAEEIEFKNLLESQDFQTASQGQAAGRKFEFVGKAEGLEGSPVKQGMCSLLAGLGSAFGV